MANWTAAELAQAVLTRLGICGAGQTAAAEDAAIVTKSWESVYPQLRKLNLAPWGSSAIEEEAQTPLEKYMAGQVQSTFGIPEPEYSQRKHEAAEGFSELKAQYSQSRHAYPIRQHDF